MNSFLTLGLFFLAAAAAAPLPAPQQLPTYGSGLPFNQIVAFGDELSDNGNGSYAHGITGSPANVYGYGTWTNGPVAVSYLNDKLSLGKYGLRDYAFGGANGGAEFGATLDNTYTKSSAGAASLVDQIHNYIHSRTSVYYTSNTLAFLWVGQNDLSQHTDAFWLEDSQNAQFAQDFSSKIAAAVQTLLDAGVPYVMVANIYPKHIAPVTAAYLCGSDTNCVETWGQVISDANAALKSALQQFGKQVIYYDSFSYIKNLANAAYANGFTQPVTNFCDGQSNWNWQDCMVDGNAGDYFWMNYIQPTTKVHEMIAEDMRGEIWKHFGSG
ncbi:uncharacterized protein PV09_06148 [Verruconis gallopava]|uniref:SGNH hydrolase-type esterase domain-containing protein n=1 Tax=Verruconis gallopava TaxID=253628 RepID=A0A0D1YQ21_9PEZI|nr:uncharacterized protein PV09_06148 [Verruconis gallopava]KIW02712.1 hypothetical protein PV09_06148 [Verruconis gallopava]